jgi:hypothetical protein
MRGRDSRFQSFIPVAQHQPRRRSPCTATLPVMESTFCGFLIPEESDCVPSILELHAAWEAMFVDDVNIGDAAGRSALPEKSLPDTRKRFHAAPVSVSFEYLVESFPRSCPRKSLYFLYVSGYLAHQDTVSCRKCLQSMALKQTRPRPHLMASGGGAAVRCAGRASLSCPRSSLALPYTFPCRPSFDFCTRIFTTGAFARQLTNASPRQTLSFAGIRVSAACARRLLTDYSSVVMEWWLRYCTSRSV